MSSKKSRSINTKIEIKVKNKCYLLHLTIRMHLNMDCKQQQNRSDWANEATLNIDDRNAKNSHALSVNIEIVNYVKWTEQNYDTKHRTLLMDCARMHLLYFIHVCISVATSCREPCKQFLCVVNNERILYYMAPINSYWVKLFCFAMTPMVIKNVVSQFITWMFFFLDWLNFWLLCQALWCHH